MVFKPGDKRFQYIYLTFHNFTGYLYYKSINFSFQIYQNHIPCQLKKAVYLLLFYSLCLTYKRKAIKLYRLIP